LLAEILDFIKTSPFVTEGTKKVHARLRRRGIKAARHRVNRLMREHGLLSPQRCEPGDPKKHDGTIIPDGINQIWDADGTLFGTVNGDLFALTKPLALPMFTGMPKVIHKSKFLYNQVVGRWMELYNTQWLIERHGHQTPREVREVQQIKSAVA
jgi:hypothetical protein